MASISGRGAKGHHTYTLTLTETATSVANNTSTVSFSFDLTDDANWFWEGWNQSITYSVSANGSVVASGSIPNHTTKSQNIAKGTITVPHNADGTKSISYSFSVSDGANQYYTSGNASASGTMVLSTIPRATTPTFSSKNVTMGSAITITMTPAASTFKHKLRYSWSTLTQQTSGFSEGADFTAQGTVSATFTPPTSLANYIPSTSSGTCTVQCYTYDSSGNHIGTVDTNITLAVPSYSPSGTISITGNNLLSSTYVQGKSTMSVSITGSTSYGASISSYSSVVDGKTYTGNSFTTGTLGSGSKSVVTTITDSRGKTASVTSSAVTVYEYNPPKITSFSLARQSDNTTVIATVKGTISSVNSKNAKTVKVVLNGVTNTITASSYTISGTTTFTGVPTDVTLIGSATLTDSYTTVKQDSMLPTVAVTMDFYKDGKGVAFGKVAETSELLDVAWEIKTGKPEKTLTNLSYHGTNVFNNGSDDTASNWGKLGNLATTFYTDSSGSIGKPSIWGLLLNVAAGVDTTEVHQLWFEQSSGSVFHRGGNGSGLNPWKRIIDNSNIGEYVTTPSDYVVETGTSGIWSYRKWNSGIAECWGNLSITPTTGNATNSHDVSLPFAFISDSSSTYKVQITPAKTALYVGSVGDCNSSNNLSHASTSFIFSYKYNNATPYNVSFNLHVSGKWK